MIGRTAADAGERAHGPSLSPALTLRDRQLVNTSDPAGHAPSLRLNVVANYVGKLWSVASIYLFVPFYIQLLGISAYGLIAFYSVALAILFIAEAGLSASFARQAARETDTGRLKSLMVSTEVVLFGMLVSAGLVMAVAAPLIAEHWLNAGDAMPQQLATDCVRLMPLALVPQIAMNLYTGGLYGQQRQVAANSWLAAFTAVRSGMVLVPLWLWPDPRVFFIWQAVSAWSFLLLMRYSVSTRLAAGGGFSWAIIRSIAGYAGGMFAMSIISGLNTQIDRLVVSKIRPLDEFAYYSLAATLAQVPSLVTLPIGAALLPRLTQLVERRESARLRGLYELNTYLVAAVAAATAFVVIFFCPEILAVWLPGRPVPHDMFLVVRILSLGGLGLALQLLPLQLSLAHGHTATNVALGASMLAVTVPLQITLPMRYGLVGAAVPWLLVNAVAFVVLGTVLNRRFHDGRIGAWFLRLMLPPVLISLGTLAVARWAVDRWQLATWPALATAAFALTILALLCYAARPRAASGG